MHRGAFPCRLGAALICAVESLMALAQSADVRKPTWLPNAGAMPAAITPRELMMQMGGSGDLPAPGLALSGPLGLNEAVREAVNHHPSIADTIAALGQQVGGVDVARAGYFPQVRVGLGGGNNSLYHASRIASASVSQMLYDFGKVSGAVSQAEASVRRQQALVLKQIDVISLQTAEAIVNVHRYQLLTQISSEQVVAVERVLNMAKLRAQSGISSRSDPIQALSRVENARANALQAASLQTQARERLRTLLGGGALPAAAADLPVAQAAALPADTDPELALLPDVLVAEAERQVAQAQLDGARAQRWPTVTLDAAVNKSIDSLNPATGERNGVYSTLMINVVGTLYQGGALEAQVRAAVSGLEAARQRGLDARLTASDQVRVSREQMRGNQSRLGVLLDRKKSINEARDIYRDQYQLGTRSILDLLNAEQEYYQAASDEVIVFHDYWIALVNYVNASGLGRDFYHLNHTTVQGLEILP